MIEVNSWIPQIIGNEFQTVAQATEKARLPNMQWRTRGTDS